MDVNALMSLRIGTGYDVHRLVPDRPLIVGGIEIPYHLGLEGHSDADVLLHTICDALLGAASLRDIGYHFPDTDPQYKGADSKRLLHIVGEMLEGKGYAIINIDCVIVAQAPKMTPHIPAMVDTISSILNISSERVSIKASTNERLGAIGRGEGIVSIANALVFKS